MKEGWINTRLVLGFILAPVIWVGEILLTLGTALVIWFISRVSHYDEGGGS